MTNAGAAMPGGAPKQQLSHLLSAGRIGGLTLRNRIFVTAMGVNLAEPDGFCGERIRAWHSEQARGGAALIVMGVVGVGWPRGANIPRQVAISDDRFIPGLRDVVRAVHAHGARLAAQLHLGGLHAMEDVLAERPVWTPSVPIDKPSDLMEGFLDSELAETPFSRIRNVKRHVMTLEDIAETSELFAAAARRAREAGIDAVEIHAAHGYLLSSFLSPITNRREDAYGGSLPNRARLLLEVLGAVRAAVGSDYPVWCKLDSEEIAQADGIKLQDAIETAALVERAGADAIAVSAYHDNSRAVLHSGSHTPDQPGLLLANAARIKAAVSVPVITAGRIEPEVADREIAGGRLDFVAMGRKLLADPHLPRKLASGQPERIRPCVYCYTCISETYLCRSVKCAVNPELAFEHECWSPPVSHAKHVAVIGGGPGGMEAARRLAARGHAVTLIERAERLGGTLFHASTAYAPNDALLVWLERRVRESGVKLRLGTTATPEVLKALDIDDVVVATGAARRLPQIPGADRPGVYGGDDLRALLGGGSLTPEAYDRLPFLMQLALRVGTALGMTRSPGAVRAASRAWMPLGRRIVIIGGELVGLELALFLAQRRRHVAVLEEGAKLGAGLPCVRRWRVLHELHEAGVQLNAGVRDVEIAAQSVLYRDARFQSQVVPADSVIVASGASADTSLADRLERDGFKVHRVGDCTGVGYIAGAMRSAALVARVI